MCLAVAPNRQCNNGFLSRVWRRISSTPLRLLSFCALVHSLILLSLFAYTTATALPIDTSAYTFALAYGIVALLAFGCLLTWLPGKYSLSPVHYARYNAIYLFMMAGLTLVAVGILLGNNWLFGGMLLFIPAWLIAVQTLWQAHTWLNTSAQSVSRVLILLLCANFLGLGLSIAGQVFDAYTLARLASSTSLLLVWPVLSLAAVILLWIAPARRRVISL